MPFGDQKCGYRNFDFWIFFSHSSDLSAITSLYRWEVCEIEISDLTAFEKTIDSIRCY